MTVIQMQKNNLLTEVREFFKLAVPLASAQVAQSATGFADTVMMGRMGADVLAAGGLAAITFLCIMMTASGVAMGVSLLIAEAFGAGQKTRVEHIARQGLWLSVLVSIPTMLFTGHLDVLLSRTGQTETTVQLANTYLDIMLWGLFPVVGFAALRATVSALSQARPIMLIVVSGTAFNIVWNYILGFGKFGFPKMGIAGLALASVMALWGMFLALAVYILTNENLKHYRIFQELHRVRPRILKELAWVGVPIGLFSGLETGFFMVITFWMGLLGTDVLAAHQIVFQTIVVVFMVPLGISYATTVRVGQWLGRRNRTGIQQAALVSMSVSTVFMIGVSAIFLFFPEFIIGLYIDATNPVNANIVAIALPLLMIAAVASQFPKGVNAQVLDGFQKAVYGSLQGLQDTQIPMLLNVLGYWGVGLSAGYVFGFQLQMGGVGLWIGQLVAIAVVAGLFIWRFWRLVKHQQLTQLI